MSFDVNPPSSKPIIREAASMQNDGGAGNLGYFEQGENKEKKHQQESIFTSGQESDTFVRESDKEDFSEDFSISGLIAKIIFAVREWVKKIY